MAFDKKKRIYKTTKRSRKATQHFTRQNEGDHGYTACLPTPRSWCPRALRVLPRAVQGHAVYSFRHLLSVCRLPRFLLTKQVPVEQRLTTGDSARSTPSMEQSNSLSFRAQLMAGWPTSPPFCIWLQRGLPESIEVLMRHCRLQENTRYCPKHLLNARYSHSSWDTGRYTVCDQGIAHFAIKSGVLRHRPTTLTSQSVDRHSFHRCNSWFIVAVRICT